MIDPVSAISAAVGKVADAVGAVAGMPGPKVENVKARATVKLARIAARVERMKMAHEERMARLTR